MTREIQFDCKVAAIAPRSRIFLICNRFTLAIWAIGLQWNRSVTLMSHSCWYTTSHDCYIDPQFNEHAKWIARNKSQQIKNPLTILALPNFNFNTPFRFFFSPRCSRAWNFSSNRKIGMHFNNRYWWIIQMKVEFIRRRHAWCLCSSYIVSYELPVVKMYDHFTSLLQV